MNDNARRFVSTTPLAKGEPMKNISKHSVLMELKALLPELATRFKVMGLELFCSVVREEQHEKSDIDLLVEKVDVVPKRALRAELQSAVLAEAIAV